MLGYNNNIIFAWCATLFDSSAQGFFLKKCDNCKECPVKAIGDDLLKVYMYSKETFIFEGCVSGAMEKNDNPNILCFTKYWAKKNPVNWKELSKFLEEHRNEFKKAGVI